MDSRKRMKEVTNVKRRGSRLLAVCIMILMAAALVPAGLARAEQEEKQATILFTHDMHSHLLPANDEAGKSYGGYARLKTAIDAQKELYPDALLVDGGDFSMGSLFQTVFSTDAAELRIMGALGYDATTFGNHEYDYRAAGLADMLNAAVDSKEPLPAILEANYKPPKEGEEGYDEDSEAVWAAFERYGVKDYMVINRGGINYAIFGVMGVDSHECAPMSGMVLQDTAAVAQQMVDLIQAEVPEPYVIVCLSHSGTWEDPKESEDEILAKEVDGIDVIVSGHTHTTLKEPIEVDGTYIVSAGEYSKYLGVITLNLAGDDVSLGNYELIPIDDTLEEDEAIAAKIEEYKVLVEKSYLSQFGDLTFDQVIATNPYAFDSTSDLNDYHRESALGNLIADSYRWAVKQAEGEVYVNVDFALTANGVIRASLAQGDLTVSDVFDVSSLGIGADGIPGYPLVSVWITGADLKNAFEVDASVTGLMSAAQLYFTGMEFTFNSNRMIFNKVTDCAQVMEDGTRLEIQDDKLYRVVTGLYCGQMLGAVNDQSFGILTITPRDAQGNAITDLEAYIVHDKDGNEIKEWYALTSYLQDMGTISEEYSRTQGRKVVDESLNPINLLKDPRPLTLIVWAVVLVVILLLVFGVRAIVRRCKRRKKVKE